MQVASIAVNCMENALQLLVPLKVKVNVGSDWSNLKLYTAKIHGHKYDSIVESEKYVQLNSVSRFIFESVDSQASFNYDGDI